MKLPDVIRFGSKKIKIIKIPASVAEKRKILGEYCSNTETITIDQDLNLIQSSNTLIHELCHFIFDEYCLDEETKKKDEEKICNSMANALCHLLHDNPQLLDYIYNSLKK